MRYIKPTEFRHNPRQPIAALDAVVQAYQKERFTFGEEEALRDLWQAGEDIRLREDPRFWELERTGHFHLSHQTLANDILAKRLWLGVWDGTDIPAQLASLDNENENQFHVFCPRDSCFVERRNQLFLVARPAVALEPTTQTALDAAAGTLVQRQRELGIPLTTLQIREHLDQLGVAIPDTDDLLDTIEGWLRQRLDWTEVARALWLPTDLVPTLEQPKSFRVLRVVGRDSEPAAETIEIIDGPSESSAPEKAVSLPDPPIERHPDSSITWTHTLRTIHLQGCYLPVPVAARFRYPRFVGTGGSVAIHCVVHESGREGLLWLDREHNRFFGDLLSELLEWEEAGRKLHLHWQPSALVIRRGEIDGAVHEEERRHLDPNALHELRLGKGESYRQCLVTILRGSAHGLEFKSICDEIAKRQDHQPSRATIRTVLHQSPGFFLEDGRWRWRDDPDSARVFRRRMIMSRVLGKGEKISNLPELTRVVENAVAQLVPAVTRPEVVEELKTHVVSHREKRTTPMFIPLSPGKRRPRGVIPVYPLKIAAGSFSEGGEAPQPDGWVKIAKRGDLSGYFAARVNGRSMEPLIPNGALCLFHRQMGGVAGSRQDRVVLARHSMIDDPDSGGSFTVKRYKRITPLVDNEFREKVVVHLVPENPEFEPIVLVASHDEPVTIVAEFVEVLSES